MSAISAYPRLAAAQEALDAGRFTEAAQIALAHAREHPNEPRGLGLLGVSAARMGALSQGEQFLRRALVSAPDDHQILRELATCVHQQERLTEALELFERVIEQDPDDLQARVVTAQILDKLGRADEARSRFEQLIEQYPTNTNAWLAYAFNLRAAGRTDESVEAYRRAVEISPERGDAWWGMASIKKNVFTDEDVAAMTKALESTVDIKSLSNLRFALGKAAHEQGAYERAFDHYTEANRLCAELLNYDAEGLTEEIEEAERLFDRNYFEAEPVGGDPSSAPIFIVSLPRSGSTLLEQMLGSHADIEALGELPHMPPLLRTVMERAMRRGITSVPQALRGLSPAERGSLGQEYLRRAALHRTSDVRHFTDKLPHNWSNLLLIREMLPNARFIDIRRDAIDCCFSNFTHAFSRAHASSFALEHIGRTYVDYVRFMDHLDRAAPGMVHHVRYEELIAEPARVLRGVMDYLGLPWDDAMLRFYETDRTVRTPSAEQVRRPLNREGVDAWKPYEQWLGPLREVLGPLAED